MEVFTIGHSNRDVETFLGLLEEAGVDTIVDVRSMPGSRHNPQFNSEALRETLSRRDIDYRHSPALGGRRRSTPGDSPNGYWREKGFRNYADYALTEEFREGLDALEALARRCRAAVMCSEAVWWRCHRRLITDYLLADGARVRHILDHGKIEDAAMTPAAERRPDGKLVYPPKPEEGLPLWEASR